MHDLPCPGDLSDQFIKRSSTYHPTELETLSCKIFLYLDLQLAKELNILV